MEGLDEGKRGTVFFEWFGSWNLPARGTTGRFGFLGIWNLKKAVAAQARKRQKGSQTRYANGFIGEN